MIREIMEAARKRFKMLLLIWIAFTLFLVLLLLAYAPAQDKDPRLDQINQQRQQLVQEYQKGSDMRDAIKRMDDAIRGLNNLSEQEQKIIAEQKAKAEAEKKKE